MNCQEFRNQLLIDPWSEDAAFRDHARACPDCARAAAQALLFEDSLRQALAAEASDVEEPELHRRALSVQGVRFALFFLPLLLAAIWLSLSGGGRPGSAGDLAAAVIAHITSEKEHLRAEGRIPRERLRKLFALFGADASPNLGRVSFADRCVIDEEDGIHLVLPGEQGAVTVLFMPEKKLAEEREVAGDGLAGKLIPAGSGSLAVVGVPGEPLEPIVRRLRESVRWDGSDKED